jgi:diguanylate cyclase (GGDEF)-like protein/PAS domain S-box-containing protein
VGHIAKAHANKPAEEARLKTSLLALVARRRDAILEAIAVSAKELLRSADLDASLSKVIEHVGPAAGADRLHILLKGEAQPGECGFIGKHYVWTAPGVTAPADFYLAIGKSMAEMGVGSWSSILKGGEVIAGNARDFDSRQRKLLGIGGVQSVLAVPIFIEGEWCGVIGLDDCRAEREWLPSEIETIKILAELVSAAIFSSRRLQVLADANRTVESSPTVVYRLGPKPPFPLIFVSKNIQRYGYDAEELLASPDRWQQLIHTDDLPITMSDIASLAQGEGDFTRREIRVKCPDGSFIWFDGRTVRLCDQSGRLIALEGVMTDVTARKEIEQKLAASQVLLRAAIENSPDGILIVDQNARITGFNRNFADMWKIPQELIDAGDHGPVLNFAASCMKNEGEFLERVRSLYAHPDIGIHDELETKDGHTFDRHSAPLCDANKQYLGRIWFFRDITQRKAAEQTIIELARTDALTGLPNRVAFLDRLRLAFARAKRGTKPFAVLYLDIDRFKDINDTLGHPAGDALLKVAAERLKACVRQTDMVARFGGDEFAVLQEDLANVAGAEVLAAKICRALAAPLSINGNQIHSGASIGIVPYQDEVDDPEAMMSKADLALYRAKSEGRDRYRFHMRELDEKVRERVKIGEGLHAAIENKELELYYQPQVELASGCLVGFEALIRWNHPERGLLLPDQFIPIAESNGSILQVGQWVIERACRQIAAWRRQRIAPAFVAVNVSTVQFKLASNFDGLVAASLAKYGVAPEQLELELTESVLMEATQRHCEEFERLRRLGVHIAIDDFGTGYSSLAYLRSFSVSRLKIDRRFVAGVITNSDDATIVQAIIGLARALGIEVVAEGVETAEQCEFLISAGCQFGQGYHFGRPLPAADAAALSRRCPPQRRNRTLSGKA